MNGNWKKFTIIVSALLAFVIICTAVNVSIDKMTQSVSAESNITQTNLNGEVINSDNVVADDNGQAVADNNAVIDATTIANGQANTTASSNGTVVNSNNTAKSSGGSSSSTANPTSYSKAQLVSYYNSCLKKTYSQSSFTVSKTEVVDVSLNKLLLNGSQKNGIQSIANSVVEKNKKNETTKKSFSNGNIADNERYILPTNLYASAVKSSSVSKSGSGYVVTFTLNAEKCNFTTKPPYNSSCTFPLDFNEIDLGGLGEITSAEFYYPGTKLTATIDGNGRVIKTYVVMPLTVTNASGNGKGIASGFTVTADISGQWLCTNIFSF